MGAVVDDMGALRGKRQGGCKARLFLPLGSEGRLGGCGVAGGLLKRALVAERKNGMFSRGSRVDDAVKVADVQRSPKVSIWKPRRAAVRC